MCKVLKVSKSGYYAWRTRPISQREMANQDMVKKIKTIHKQSRKTYGSPRVHEELIAQGVSCSQNRVARLMRLNDIQAKQVKLYKSTTKRNRNHPVAPNLLARDFDADYPNHKWLADITYIATMEGWMYLAVILDLYSRSIVGWAMSDRMTSNLTKKALQMALQKQQPRPGLIHHSDQGRQYTDHTYQQVLADHAIQASMNGVGSWYDNAPMESFFASLKMEAAHHRIYRTQVEARTALFDYIEVFYNRVRRHSSLGYLSPAIYVQQHYTQH
jgi:transposase InsO family protein